MSGKREATYVAAKASKAQGPDLDALIAACIEIDEEFGDLKPADLVERARPEDSPIHHLFNWDDADAADKFRLNQARGLINHVEIELEIRGDTQLIKAFQSVRVKEGSKMRQTYKHVFDVKAQPVTSRDLVQRAWKELQMWQRKYRNLHDYFGDLFDYLDVMDPPDGSDDEDPRAA